MGAGRLVDRIRARPRSRNHLAGSARRVGAKTGFVEALRRRPCLASRDSVDGSHSVQPVRLQFALLDPQVARELGIVAANLLDEALGVPQRMNVSTASPRRLASRGSWPRATRASIGQATEGWVKIKNPNYWRRDSERWTMQRAAARRSHVVGTRFS